MKQFILKNVHKSTSVFKVPKYWFGQGKLTVLEKRGEPNPFRVFECQVPSEVVIDCQVSSLSMLPQS